MVRFGLYLGLVRQPAKQTAAGDEDEYACYKMAKERRTGLKKADWPKPASPADILDVDLVEADRLLGEATAEMRAAVHAVQPSGAVVGGRQGEAAGRRGGQNADPAVVPAAEDERAGHGVHSGAAPTSPAARGQSPIPKTTPAVLRAPPVQVESPASSVRTDHAAEDDEEQMELELIRLRQQELQMMMRRRAGGPRTYHHWPWDPGKFGCFAGF